MKRKRRTREHIIADLAVNHVERAVLRCGYTVERHWHDYGFDLLLYTYNNNGEYENGDVRIQVKATDHLKRKADGKTIVWPLEVAHLNHWLKEPMPVMLIVYDALEDRAYWLYIQRYFEQRRRPGLAGAADKLSVDVPTGNVFDGGAVRQFAEFRNNILAQVSRIIRHG
jgi:hypothetical protein